MPPIAESDNAAAAPRASLGTRITERLPEIVIEALFMLVAVVLAFAVEEWREERELDGLAAEARGAILQEVTSNREELIESNQGDDRCDRRARGVARAGRAGGANHVSHPRIPARGKLGKRAAYAGAAGPRGQP